ncbi:RnfABCDGE type electron transport complex subunit D [Candidatus Jidaibacter acanthamoebae]|nr:RnfABCDGE type electron transport complex subunit D [Candidatus Jidaibacter acanthamoeba]
MQNTENIKKIDVRSYQMAAQVLFLTLGIYFLDFDINYFNVFITMLSTIFTQYICCLFFKQRFEAKNAVITGLSLSLVLRSNDLVIFILAGVVAILSKFIIRFNNRHIFNPAIFGLISVLLFSNSAWISPGQWGTLSWVLALLIIIGLFVAVKSNRLDVALAFISTYIVLTGVRGFWLNEPLNLIFYQFENGAAFLFTFFTISDPKTTPQTSSKRIVFGIIAGVWAMILRYYFYNPYYIVYSLALTSGMILLIKIILSFEYPKIFNKMSKAL